MIDRCLDQVERAPVRRTVQETSFNTKHQTKKTCANVELTPQSAVVSIRKDQRSSVNCRLAIECGDRLNTMNKDQSISYYSKEEFQTN